MNHKQLLHSMASGQMQAYFQPKFDLQTGHVEAAEALARLHHPVKGLLLPGVFLAQVDRCGLMDALFLAQLNQGLCLQQQALAQGQQLNIAFNLKAEQLADVKLIVQIEAALSAYGLPGEGLTFELTEGSVIKAHQRSLDNAMYLRTLGCRLSIDDFGSGYSSLYRLCELPFNEIKLDRSFVAGLEHEPRCKAVIRNTLALGRALGAEVVLEGIETDAQRLQLLELGGVQGQGYWCAPAMAAGDFLSWLGARHSREDQ